jgi:hypothetical protein
MVEQRFGNYTYAKWRDDKEASKGYTRELISSLLTDPKYYENLDQPHSHSERTLIDLFEKHCKNNPGERFLGTRPIDAEGVAGDYEWKSYAQVKEAAQAIGRGMCELDLAPQVEGD